MKKKIVIIASAIVVLLLIAAAAILYPLMYKGTDQIVIVENQKFTTLDQILKQDFLNNKTVVVDMWGTYCSPCIKEFDNAAQLKAQFKNKPVEFLYLCTVERIDHKLRWKKIIQDKQLNGYHIAIDSEELFDDIWNNYLSDPVEGKYMIPRYFIVKNGEVVVSNAQQPSSKELLYNQIDSVLNL